MASDLVYPPGPDGDAAAADIQTRKTTLKNLKILVTTCYDGPNKDVKGISHIKNLLNKPEGSGVYLLMADDKAKYHRAQLSHLP